MIRRHLGKAALALIALVAMSSSAWAYWTTQGTGSASSTVDTLNAATISAPAASTGSVTITWTVQASLPGNPSQNSGITYTVERKLGAGSYAAISGGGCSGSLPHGTASCTDSASAGTYFYRVIAHYRSWTAISSEAGPVVVAADSTPPTVQSINRDGSSPTNASSVQFDVSFSESVSGVDATDFALATSGVSGAAITSVGGSGSSYTVTVGTGSGNGSIGLNLVDNDSIQDGSGNRLGGTGTGNGNFTGQIYTIDKTAPTVQSINRHSSSPTNTSSVQFDVSFSESVSGVGTADFTLVASGVSGASITSAGGSGSSYTVTVATGSGDGSIGLNLVDDDTILDGAGNSLGGSGAGNGSFTGQTYAIDKTAPSLSSLQMFDTNTNGKIDQVKAIFSESLASYSAGTAPWTLTNVPSNGSLGSVSVSAATATLTITEGSGAANTAVGSFKVALAQSANGVRDAVGNQSSFEATAPTDKAGPVPVSLTDSSGTADGKFELADTMTVTFSEPVTGVGTSANVALTGGNGSNDDKITVPGLLSAQTALSRSDYISGNGSVANFGASALTQPATNQIRLTLAACTGACASITQAAGAGNFAFTPVNTITDVQSNVAAGNLTVSIRLF